MNERIKRLVEDANLRHFINEDGSLTPELHYFAESIVKECAEVSENYAAGSMPLSIALAIKEHFGVEE
jgi:hypothetical protein